MHEKSLKRSLCGVNETIKFALKFLSFKIWRTLNFPPRNLISFVTTHTRSIQRMFQILFL